MKRLMIAMIVLGSWVTLSASADAQIYAGPYGAYYRPYVPRTAYWSGYWNGGYYGVPGYGYGYAYRPYSAYYGYPSNYAWSYPRYYSGFRGYGYAYPAYGTYWGW